jgi:molecular chaperone DnaJ
VVRKDGHTGDLLVTVDVQVPAHLDDNARKAVEALRDATQSADLRANLFDARSRPGSSA